MFGGVDYCTVIYFGPERDKVHYKLSEEQRKTLLGVEWVQAEADKIASGGARGALSEAKDSGEGGAQEGMKELCARHNCEEVRVDGDGNCQFRALSLGLYGSEDHHADVRANIVQHLRENPETYSAFMEPDEDFAEYINRISQDGQWGDEVTLRAFERCNGRGVRVLSDNEQNPVINPTFEGPLEDTITITHYGELHYNGTKPIRA